MRAGIGWTFVAAWAVASASLAGSSAEVDWAPAAQEQASTVEALQSSTLFSLDAVEPLYYDDASLRRVAPVTPQLSLETVEPKRVRYEATLEPTQRALEGLLPAVVRSASTPIDLLQVERAVLERPTIDVPLEQGH